MAFPLLTLPLLLQIKTSLYGDANLLSQILALLANASLFSNKNSKCVSLPSSVLSSTNPLVLNQLPMNLGLFTSNSIMPWICTFSRFK